MAFCRAFVDRSYALWMVSTGGPNCRTIWTEVNGNQYHRLNVSLDQDISIDDVRVMESLRGRVRNQTNLEQRCKDIMTTLLSSSFYLALDREPQFEDGIYNCTGTVRCRNNCHAVLQAFCQMSCINMRFVTDTGYLAHVGGMSDVCTKCRLYTKRVRFTVRHPREIITIYLEADGDVRRRISGFPQSMEWFVIQQELGSVFGTQEHDAPGRPRCGSCDGRGGQKRKVSPNSSRAQKRLRGAGLALSGQALF